MGLGAGGWGQGWRRKAHRVPVDRGVLEVDLDTVRVRVGVRVRVRV